MATCSTEKRPVFWQPQTRLPVSAARCLRVRLEAILAQPEAQGHLLWPAILGAPRLLEAHPMGIPEPVLLEKASVMLGSIGSHMGAEEAWRDTLARFPDTATQDAHGWLPHEAWASHASQISLRSGVMLLSFMGQPQDERFPLHAGVALFNGALFHEAHDAFEKMWSSSRGHLKKGLQGLIMLAAGFHHLQMQHAPGMLALWKSAQDALGDLEGVVDTPWGRVDMARALHAAVLRLDWLWEHGETSALDPLWDLDRPFLEIHP